MLFQPLTVKMNSIGKVRQPLLQPSLKIGQPGDQYEQEADAVADKVMTMNQSESMQMQPMEEEEEEMMQPKLRMKPLDFANDNIQMKCAECEEEEILQTKSDSGGGYATPAISQNIQKSKGNGKSLPEHTNQFMSNAFGADFSGVQIHTGSEALKMNQQLGAKAFTFGNDIYFNSGKYDTNSKKGQHLLAHELTHVAQQGAAKTIQKQEAVTPAPEAVLPETAPVEHPDCYGRTLSESETQQRLTIYQDLTRGLEDVSQRENILSAMCSFSINQFNLMMEAGVRFWPPGSVPPLRLPEDTSVEAPGRGLSSYIPNLRIIRLSTSSVSALRHELAHAWDHVRVMRRRFRLDDLSGDRLISAITAESSLGSESDRRHRVGGSTVRFSIEQMYEAYRGRMRGRPREEAFGTPVAREGYSLTNVRDFYAEGYAVFNSGLAEQQARMRSQAQELYEYFRLEAERERLPIPSVEELEP